MSTIWAFDDIENRDTLHREEGCTKKFFESLREHAKNITNFEKEKLLPITKENLKSDQDAKLCYICSKKILKKLSKSIIYPKGRDHCHYAGKYRDAAHGICNLKLKAWLRPYIDMDSKLRQKQKTILRKTF